MKVHGAGVRRAQIPFVFFISVNRIVGVEGGGMMNGSHLSLCSL